MDKTKICKACNQEKPFSEYWKQKEGKHGLAPRCKDCKRAYAKSDKGKALAKERAKRFNKRHPGVYKEKQRAWRLDNPDKIRERKQRLKERWPQKYEARTIVANAVRGGTLVPQPCRICGAEKAEAHHPDYSKPLEVIWLCVPHHKAWHRVFLTEDDPRDGKAFIMKDGVLTQIEHPA